MSLLLPGVERKENKRKKLFLQGKVIELDIKNLDLRKLGCEMDQGLAQRTNPSEACLASPRHQQGLIQGWAGCGETEGATALTSNRYLVSGHLSVCVMESWCIFKAVPR